MKVFWDIVTTEASAAPTKSFAAALVLQRCLKLRYSGWVAVLLHRSLLGFPQRGSICLGMIKVNSW